MSLPKVPNPAQVVLELPPGYEGSGDPRPRSAEPTALGVPEAHVDVESREHPVGDGRGYRAGGLRLALAEGRDVKDASARRGFSEPRRNGQVHEIGNAVREPVQVERGLEGARGLRSVVAAPAPEPESNEVVVFGERERFNAIHAVSGSFEIAH